MTAAAATASTQWVKSHLASVPSKSVARFGTAGAGVTGKNTGNGGAHPMVSQTGPSSPKGQTTVAGPEVVGVSEDVAAHGTAELRAGLFSHKSRSIWAFLFPPQCLDLTFPNTQRTTPPKVLERGRRSFSRGRQSCPWRRQQGRSGATRGLRRGPDCLCC